MRGAGRVAFAGTLLLIAGTLNIIYGIGAIGDASIFVNDKRFIFSNLHAMGWVLIILGIIRAGLGAIGALLSIGGNDPWWSLGVFVLCVFVLHGILVFGEDEQPAGY